MLTFDEYGNLIVFSEKEGKGAKAKAFLKKHWKKLALGAAGAAGAAALGVGAYKLGKRAMSGESLNPFQRLTSTQISKDAQDLSVRGIKKRGEADRAKLYEAEKTRLVKKGIKAERQFEKDMAAKKRAQEKYEEAQRREAEKRRAQKEREKAQRQQEKARLKEKQALEKQRAAELKKQQAAAEAKAQQKAYLKSL